MYRYCNSNSFASVVAAVLLALCLCSCGNENITVKTELTDGETVKMVELSDGELFFKSRDDVVSELTPQDFEDAKPKASEYHLHELPLEAYSLDGVRYTDEEESMRLLNIYPENWAIPESCGTSPRCLYHVPSFYTLENGEYEYADFYMFNYMYDVNMRPPGFINTYFSRAAEMVAVEFVGLFLLQYRLITADIRRYKFPNRRHAACHHLRGKESAGARAIYGLQSLL